MSAGSPEAHKTSKISIALSEEQSALPRARIKGAVTKKPSTRTKRPSTPERIHPIPRKAKAGKLLPGATFFGLSDRDLNKYVAWDGKQYVLCPSRDNVLADDSLIPIGSVRELRVDHPHLGLMGQVEVVIPTHQGSPSSSVGANTAVAKSKSDDLVASPTSDYRSISFNGKTYSLTRNQAVIVKLLHGAHRDGMPAVGKDRLLAEIGVETSRIRDSFKNSPLWGTLILTGGQHHGGRRGTYWLNLAK
jgi:hypothetical protein